ncbi:SART-1 family protein DOT2 [Spatholobus suberectus]|nr:SART-1 family protein DOT2 [Spatholobus suberectus]
MEEFVWGLHIDEEARKPESEDVFMHDDEEANVPDEEKSNEAGGWTEVQETSNDEQPNSEDKEEIVPDETIHEVAVGKGLSGALKLLKERGTLKESIEWGGRNMDKKKSKLVGIVDDEEKEAQKKKEIRIERTDEFGRILTPKEAFRMISHKFHGKGPGKMKQEKRMKQYQEELKMKQMKSSDTPSLSVERMREAQARLQTPYLVLSGHVKPGQTSDPKSGFATVEKDLPGGLTPMLGDRKVEHFLGIKRKAEPSNSDTPKKPKS